MWPPSARLPSTVHTLRRYFLRAYPECQSQAYSYCDLCHRVLQIPQEVCEDPGCGGNPDYFICTKLELQVKRLLEDPVSWELLQKRFRPNDVATCIRDIYDGAAFRKHSTFLSNPANISFTLNTDGVSLYRSSSISIWPVWLVVNELPPRKRFMKKYMILGGLWYSRDKPTMLTYLRPLLDAVNKLYHSGIQVATPSGQMCAHAVLLAYAVDLPARAILLEMKQFNGKCACVYCEDEGEIEGSNHLHRFWPYREGSKRRTHSSLLQNATQATVDQSVVQGVKAMCVLFVHKPCDLVTGCVVDDLHCLYLGVTKALLHLWLDKTNSKQPFYIGNKVSECDARLLRVQVPDVVSRVPKSLTDLAHWKGSEYRNWVLFYALPVLEGILPVDYLTHMSLMVASLHLLSSDHITPLDLDNSRKWLLSFYKDFSKLYGKKRTTMNVHMMSHLVDCVTNWGPLWAYSCFTYESMNGTVKKLFHGTRNMSGQMLFSYTAMQILPSIDLLKPTQPVKLMADILSGARNVSNKQLLDDNVAAIGGITLCWLEGELLALFNAYLQTNDQPPLVPCSAQAFYRLQLDNQVFYSSEYGRVKKRNSYTVLYKSGSGTKFGLIKHYIYLNHVFLLVKQLKVLPVTCQQRFKIDADAMDIVSRVLPVTVGDPEIISVQQVVSKCMYIDMLHHQYVAKFPSHAVMMD